MLTDEQRAIFLRQIILPEIGATGQRRILASAVLCAGEGLALETLLITLACAGVGELRARGSGADLLRARARGVGTRVNPVAPGDLAAAARGAAAAVGVFPSAARGSRSRGLDEIARAASGAGIPFVAVSVGSDEIGVVTWRPEAGEEADEVPRFLRGRVAISDGVGPSEEMMAGHLAAVEAIKILVGRPPAAERVTVLRLASGQPPGGRCPAATPAWCSP
ncbi:MAG: hypothetical protein HY719_14855 [Planctomycetes bacterium]|nr:hypothetical protein [Planctomycetota bacterium]